MSEVLKTYTPQEVSFSVYHSTGDTVVFLPSETVIWNKKHNVIFQNYTVIQDLIYQLQRNNNQALVFRIPTFVTINNPKTRNYIRFERVTPKLQRNPYDSEKIFSGWKYNLLDGNITALKTITYPSFIIVDDTAGGHFLV